MMERMKEVVFERCAGQEDGGAGRSRMSCDERVSPAMSSSPSPIDSDSSQ